MQEKKGLIIGAGPTGLMMAAELARYGMPVRIIDKTKVRSSLSKALAIQPRTLEIFNILGISNPFIQRGQKLFGANPISNHKQLTHIDFTLCDSPFPFILSLPQSETEEILEKHLNGLGIFVERETELVGLQEEDSHVLCRLKHLASGTEEEIQATWVIGCDGAHSFVRRHLDLSFEGKTFSDIFSLADVKLSWKYSHDEVFAFPNASGVVAAFPLPDKNRYRLIFQLQRCRDVLNQKKLSSTGVISDREVADPTKEETLALIRQIADPDAEIQETFWMANFHINSRLASHYRKGRLFLVGDAAHIHSPVGGQGMNTGLQDAFNLGWKLSLVESGKISLERLDTYHSERHTFATNLLNATEKATYFVTLRNPIAIKLRNFFISQLGKLPAFQKLIVCQLTQVAICYPENQFMFSKGAFVHGPELGSRAPNVLFSKTNLFSIFNNPKTFFLLVFSGLHPNQKIIDRIKTYQAPKDFVGPIKIIRVLHGAENQQDFYLDANGAAHKTYGAEKASAYLIRPDTYIEARWKL